ERRHDLDLRLRPLPAHHLPQRLGSHGRVRMRDADPQARIVDRGLRERADELLHRLLVAADSLDRYDLALGDRQDGLDVQELAGHRARPADPAALREELERVYGEDEPVFLLVARY